MSDEDAKDNFASSNVPLSSRANSVPCSTEPVAKRTRSSFGKENEAPKPAQPVAVYEPTIVDILDEDCWRSVFDYVDILQVMRSEPVSKGWRFVVFRYLKRVRLYIRTLKYHNCKPARPSAACRIVEVPGQYHSQVIKKYGPAIVASDCSHVSDLRKLGRHAPDLEELRLKDPQYHSLKERVIYFSKLKRIYLQEVLRFKDAHISKVIGCTALESLKIYNNHMMTGTCLNDLKSQLKSLQLDVCKRLNIHHIIAASHHLCHLTRLLLNVNPLPVLQHVYKLLEKTPNLEHLSLRWYGDTDVGGLVEAICGLTKLQHLSLSHNKSVRDDWLETLGLRCHSLRTFEVGRCANVTPAGIIALCRGAGKTLASLGCSHSSLTDADVVLCVALCPNLELIDLKCGKRVSRQLPAQVTAAGLRRPLKLLLWSTRVELYPPETFFPNLILDFSGSVPEHKKPGHVIYNHLLYRLGF